MILSRAAQKALRQQIATAFNARLPAGVDNERISVNAVFENGVWVVKEIARIPVLSANEAPEVWDIDLGGDAA